MLRSPQPRPRPLWRCSTADWSASLSERPLKGRGARGVAADPRDTGWRGRVVCWSHFTSAAGGSSSPTPHPDPQGIASVAGGKLPSDHFLVTFLHSFASQKPRPLDRVLAPCTFPSSYALWSLLVFSIWYWYLAFDPKLPSEEKSLVLILCKEAQLF